jgi:hypothetical protein
LQIVARIEPKQVIRVCFSVLIKCMYNVVSQNAVFTPHFALNSLENPLKTAVFDDFN